MIVFRYGLKYDNLVMEEAAQVMEVETFIPMQLQEEQEGMGGKCLLYASPAATNDAVIIGGRDKLVHALDPETGQALWTYPAGSRVDSSPVIAGDRVYFGAGALVALELKSGTEVWRFETGAPITASPAVAASRLVIGATDGVLYCFGRKAIRQ